MPLLGRDVGTEQLEVVQIERDLLAVVSLEHCGHVVRWPPGEGISDLKRRRQDGIDVAGHSSKSLQELGGELALEGR